MWCFIEFRYRFTAHDLYHWKMLYRFTGWGWALSLLALNPIQVLPAFRRFTHFGLREVGVLELR